MEGKSRVERKREEREAKWKKFKILGLAIRSIWTLINLSSTFID